MKRLLFLGLLTCLLIIPGAFLGAQEKDSSYLMYLEQFRELSRTKSLNEDEIEEVLEEFAKSGVQSNEDFARLSAKLYSKEQHIGILLYFYKNDTIRRVFFEPGKIVEQSFLPVSKDSMFRLGEALNRSLRLYELTQNRAPKHRGAVDEESQGVLLPLDTIIRRLTSILIPPSFNETYKHLIVVTCLNIGTIPFHLLKPYKDQQFLIDRCSFTIVPTLVDFAALRQRVFSRLGKNGLKPNIGVIKDYDEAVRNGSKLQNPSEVSYQIERALLVSNPKYPVNTAFHFPDLPGAQMEVDSAKRYFGSKVHFQGNNAQKDSILKHLSGKDIAYFATHAMASAANPRDSSFLVLSGKAPFWTSREIMELRFRKDFEMPRIIILSACQTGLGKAMEAGVAGFLARSFILGGSNHVIMSLWSVDDHATAYIMNRFMFHTKTSKVFQPAEHLRQAVLDTKKHYPSPAHWASFSFVGVDFY